jgi:hypothetical protein
VDLPDGSGSSSTTSRASSVGRSSTASSRRWDAAPSTSQIYTHDVARSFAVALSRTEPLSPRGVMEALERVKMLPVACGEPGTRISFGKWTRRGWMGAGYLVAREVTADLRGSVLRGRLELPDGVRR